jgi:hypothetical protein
MVHSKVCKISVRGHGVGWDSPIVIYVHVMMMLYGIALKWWFGIQHVIEQNANASSLKKHVFGISISIQQIYTSPKPPTQPNSP